MHENHRERVRRRFFEDGMENMPEHNVLEMLLFYCVPRKDTNELAHRLIDAFDSLAGVLEAPADRLMQIEGVGENTAAFLTMLPQVCRRYMTQRTRPEKLTAENRLDVLEYISSLFIGYRAEAFYLLCFDAGGRLTNCCKVESGSMKNVIVDKRGLLDLAFRSSAQSVIFAHNHPNSVASPSREDVNATVELVSLFSAVDIRVLDHVIVGADDVLSMARLERFKSLFE